MLVTSRSSCSNLNAIDSCSALKNAKPFFHIGMVPGMASRWGL